MRAPLPHTLVIGIGNRNCGDDAAGREVARALAGRLPDSVGMVEHDGEAASLLALLGKASAVYLIDACASGSAAGAVRRFDVAAEPLPQSDFDVSTHGLGLAQAVELARALGTLPARSIVYAIEGEHFEPGAPLSRAVATAVVDVGDRVREEIRNGVADGVDTHA